MVSRNNIFVLGGLALLAAVVASRGSDITSIFRDNPVSSGGSEQERPTIPSEDPNPQSMQDASLVQAFREEQARLRKLSTRKTNSPPPPQFTDAQIQGQRNLLRKFCTGAGCFSRTGQPIFPKNSVFTIANLPKSTESV